jgi:PAS domain S-box-containing protein
MKHLENEPVLSQNVLEALPGAVALIDDHGVIGAVNQRLSVLTGYEREDLVGQDIAVILPDLDRQASCVARRNRVGAKASAPAPLDQQLAISC